MLQVQRPYLDKAGLSYAKKLVEESVKTALIKKPICYFCFKYGHSFESCFFTKKASKKEEKVQPCH